jgi:hypothetical protein
MNWNSITVGDLLLLDNHRLVVVIRTTPHEPFFDYGLDVYVSLLENMKPFWTESRRLNPLSCELLP